jgi:hypothetical protein
MIFIFKMYHKDIKNSNFADKGKCKLSCNAIMYKE